MWISLLVNHTKHLYMCLSAFIYFLWCCAFKSSAIFIEVFFSFFHVYVCVYVCVLGIKPRDLCMLRMLSTTKLYLQPFFEKVAQIGLRLANLLLQPLKQLKLQACPPIPTQF